MTDLLEDVDVDIGGVLEDKGGQKHLQGGERSQGWGERQVLVFATKSSPLHSFSHTFSKMPRRRAGGVTDANLQLMRRKAELADEEEDPGGSPAVV